MDRIIMDNFGENSYVAFREREEPSRKAGQINSMTFHPISGSKNISKYEDTLDNDFLTKFYIASLSFIGLYIFHNVIYS